MNNIRRPGESRAAFFTRSVGSASLAACIGETLTIPMDTAKVRLQVQKTGHGQKPRYRGLLGTMRTICAEEGARSLWNGLSAGFQRQTIFAGLRVGLYVPVRNIITGPLAPGQYPSLLQKIVTAMATGMIAIMVASPTDLVKVKLQAQNMAVLEGGQKQYAGSVDCYRQIIRAEGLRGLWTGLSPNVVRCSIFNAAEIASYDQYKQILIQKLKFEDGLSCQSIAALGAGLTACLLGSPVDVLKTRMMNAKAGQYRSPFDCFRKTLGEGPGAFYKGFGPNVMRLAAFNTAMLVIYEQFKRI